MRPQAQFRAQAEDRVLQRRTTLKYEEPDIRVPARSVIGDVRGAQSARGATTLARHDPLLDDSRAADVMLRPVPVPTGSPPLGVAAAASG
jgi:hypothetical protein